MLIHDMRFALRVMMRDRFFALANLMGLAIGLAAAAFIFLYVRNEFGYDRWIPDHASLYRIDTVESVPGQSPVEIAQAPGPLPAALQSAFPQIVESTRAYPIETSALRGADPLPVRVMAADPNFLALLGLPMLDGSAGGALSNPGSLALSRTAALRLFGTADAVGRRTTLMLPEARDFVVAAVFEDVPRNSHLELEIVVPFAAYFASAGEEVRAIPENWGGAYFHTYVRLRPGASPTDFADAMPAFVDRSLPQWLTGLLKTAPHEYYQFRFIAVRDVHFDGAAIGALRPPADRGRVVALALVAVLILLVACVNFANLTMARAMLRAREVALRKVLGADRRRIFGQFVGEALVVTALAGLIALALVELFLPWLTTAFGLPQGALAGDRLALLPAMGGLVFLTALGASVYPALAVARISPATIFNRDHAQRRAGAVRGLLVVAQFAVAIGLTILVLVMALQTRFVRDAGLGFAQERLMVIRVPDMANRDMVVRGLRDALARRPEVLHVARSSAVPTDASEAKIAVDLPGMAKPVQIGFHSVDDDFFETFGLQPVAGRLPDLALADPAAGQAEGSAAEQPVLINQRAVAELGFGTADAAIGRVIRAGTTTFSVRGVVPDMHFRSLHESVRPELYRLAADAGPVLTLRLRDGDPAPLIAAIEALWRERLPGRVLDRFYLDDRIEALYGEERRQAGLLTMFAVLAILLSCLGLLAMTAFAAARRTREIAIRKVLGARTQDIIRLLVWQFTRPVLVANLIAWPVALFAARDWLDRFAYRIELPLWAFPAAGLAALAVALLAVGRHSVAVARTPPAVALRRE
jgi:putative ABC transport system permease protein